MKGENSNNQKTLSILIPSFNDRYYVKQCIESILDSTSNDFELIISDDSSDPETLKILNNYSDSRLTLLKSKKRQGLIENWKKCLKSSNGEWVHTIHSDDYYTSGSIDQLIKNLKDRETIYLINLNCFNDESDEIFDIQCDEISTKKIFGNVEKVEWSNLLKFFNHDELSLTIFPKQKIKPILKMSKYSISSCLMYWIIAMFYNSKVSYLKGCGVMKRYNHKHKREQWGSIDKKNVNDSSLKGFFGDFLNSIILSFIFKDLNLLFKLFFYNRYQSVKRGGFYGLGNKKIPYYYPGSLINIIISPILISVRKFITFLHNIYQPK